MMTFLSHVFYGQLSSMKKNRTPKSVKSTHQILKGSNNILQSLISQSQELIRIEEIIHHHIEEPFSVASLESNDLTLIVASGALSTRLRYRERQILGSLNRAGLNINTIKIKVQPELVPPPPALVDRRLSRENALQIRQSAAYIDDESLQKALESLAKWGDEKI